MSLCTICGCIMHPEDVRSHNCDPADIPAKGQPHKPTITKRALQ